jgi:hypothetical protein
MQTGYINIYTKADYETVFQSISTGKCSGFLHMYRFFYD